MMQEIKAPNKVNFDNGRIKIFLAGSIEMGKAVDWQKELLRELEKYDVDVLNPRRDDWDSTWEQSIDNPQFNEQVTWELDCLERCHLIVMNFVEDTKSPISLLELGLFGGHKQMLVCCPKKFWRQGNVEIVCKRYGVSYTDNFHILIGKLQLILSRPFSFNITNGKYEPKYEQYWHQQSELNYGYTMFKDANNIVWHS